MSATFAQNLPSWPSLTKFVWRLSQWSVEVRRPGMSSERLNIVWNFKKYCVIGITNRIDFMGRWRDIKK